MRVRGDAVQYSRTSQCRGCGERRRHDLLLEPAAFHALRHGSVFCDACGHPATLLRVGQATAA